jgi:2-keto-4-pentenoate hydratase/2-oxohepta-3-ene-1,7-dioic acid hydratase in catechol pathway
MQMKLASFVKNKQRSFGIVEGERIVDIGAVFADGESDLRTALAADASELSRLRSDAPSFPIGEIDAWLPVIPNPDKILCIGLNYETHRQETGRPPAQYPTIFLRLANTQIGHAANLLRPKVSREFDYEGELAVIIGRPGRYISEQQALNHVAGYACYNDGSLRDWQRHTNQFTPGKNFPRTGGFGPWMVTSDEIGDVSALTLKTRLNGDVMQEARIAQMIFSVARLIAYCSSFTPLETGDVICTGTPGGVGFTRVPPVYMKPGDRIEVEIENIGTLSNGIDDEM